MVYILDHPASARAFETLGFFFDYVKQLLRILSETVVFLLEVARQDLGDWRRSVGDRSGGWMRGEVGMHHGERTIDYGHEVLGEGPVGGGSMEFHVALVGVPVWMSTYAVSQTMSGLQVPRECDEALIYDKGCLNRKCWYNELRLRKKRFYIAESCFDDVSTHCIADTNKRGLKICRIVEDCPFCISPELKKVSACTQTKRVKEWVRISFPTSPKDCVG